MHTAIIGIGPGLGGAIARCFGQQGHRISVVGRSEDSVDGALAALCEAGVGAAGYLGDASSSDRMEAVFGQMAARDGEVDNLVFNVAQIKPDRFVTASSKARLDYGERWCTRGSATNVDEFVDSLRINVAAALLCVKQVVEPMCRRRAGKILITGGTLGLSPWIEWASLSAGKAALRSLSRSLFAELRPFQVHAALVTIHDTIAPDTPYDADTIAHYYWSIFCERPEAWAAEYHFNPNAVQAVDRDLLEAVSCSQDDSSYAVNN